MKKLLLFFAATIFTVASVSAQCTPDPQYTTPGVYPDSATGLSGACAGVAYDEVITIVVPVDTSTTIGGFPITVSFDSAVVTSFTGLPPGFTYSCLDLQNTTSPTDGCTYEGGTTGCMSIVGNPTLADVGTYTLNIEVTVYVGGVTSPAATQIVDYYSIVVDDCVSGLGEETAHLFNLYPNPANESVTISGFDGIGSADLTIVNASGQEMMSYASVSGSEFNLSVSSLENGIYFVQVRHNDQIEVIRFVKQ